MKLKALGAISLGALFAFANATSTQAEGKKLELSGKNEDIKRAIVRYRAGIEANPNNVNTRLSLGRAYLITGHLQAALEQFEAAKKIAPTKADPYLGMARVYRRQKDNKKALKALKEAVLRDPNNADIHYKLGQTLL